MFNSVINIKKIKESFADNNTINIGGKYVIKKTFENNQNIDISAAITSLTKLTNTVVNDVVQNNTAIASSAVGASNEIWLSGIECQKISISNVKQKSKAVNKSNINIIQSNTSKLTTEITNSIDKKIETSGKIDTNKLKANNTELLKKFNLNPDDIQSIKNDDKCKMTLIHIGDCIETSFELDTTLKETLKLDQSFKVTDTDNISNEIKNKISQTNFASCQANASASNQIILNDIQCDAANAMSKSLNPAGEINISEIEQTAVAKLFMTCVLDQKNISEITTKIINKISKRYNQIYDAVAQKAQDLGDPTYYEDATKVIDALAGAGLEHILASTGDLPTKDSSNNIDLSKQDQQALDKTNPTEPSTQSPVSAAQPNPSEPVAQSNSPVQVDEPNKSQTLEQPKTNMTEPEIKDTDFVSQNQNAEIPSSTQYSMKNIINVILIILLIILLLVIWVVLS
jgi:hypothetical protein